MKFNITFEIYEMKRQLEKLGYRVYSRRHSITRGPRWEERTEVSTDWYADKGGSTYHLQVAFNMELKKVLTKMMIQ